MLPPFPTEEHFKQTDDELGRDLLAWWIAYNAERKGLDPYNLPLNIQERIVLNSMPMDGDSVVSAGVEKAIKRAAKGEYAKAGAMIRELSVNGIIDRVYRDEALTGKRRQKNNASKPRPKKKPTNRTMIIEEMLKWRKKARAFDEFIEAAQAGSIDGLELECIQGNKVLLSWEGIDEERKGVETLKDWWTDSKKN